MQDELHADMQRIFDRVSGQRRRYARLVLWERDLPLRSYPVVNEALHDQSLWLFFCIACGKRLVRSIWWARKKNGGVKELLIAQTYLEEAVEAMDAMLDSWYWSQQNFDETRETYEDLQGFLKALRRRIKAPVPLKVRKALAKVKTCYYCGRKGTKKKGPDGRNWHVDHVTPRSRGGCTDFVRACAHCNSSKRDRMPHEWPEGGRLL